MSETKDSVFSAFVSVSIAVLLLLSLSSPCESCNSMYRVPTASRKPKGLSRTLQTPLVLKERIPRDQSEFSSLASGLALGPILNGTREFKKLKVNNNPDIAFRDEEKTGEDRIMTQRCKDSLDQLSRLVKMQWGSDVRLKVIEAWDQYRSTGLVHAKDSLHYEGRAVDVTTSDRDKTKLSMLGRLAYNAGFDHVYFQSRYHIHCSVKSEKEADPSSNGCFHGDSIVTTKGQGPIPVSQLKIGDEVLSINPETRSLSYEKVFMFLDYQPSSISEFYDITFEDGSSIKVTGSHLIFVPSVKSPTAIDFASVSYARDLTPGTLVYSTIGNKTISPPVSQRVKSVRVYKSQGLYAPVTYSGTIIVDGVVLSCYAFVNSHHLAHLVVGPLRWLDIFCTFLIRITSWIYSHVSCIYSVITQSLPPSVAEYVNHMTLAYSEPVPDTIHDGVHWYGQVMMSLVSVIPKSLQHWLGV